MSSEEKAPDQNPDGDQLDSGVEPFEAELADSTPLPEPTVDLSSEKPIEAEVVEAQIAAPGATEQSGITKFFKDQDGTPEFSSVAMATAAGKVYSKAQSPPPLATNLQNMSANGGAMGALVLGVWCFLGSFITNWSIINGILGLLLGAWGLTSRRKKSAWVGIVLCTIGILLCLAQFSELINEWWYEVDETVGV